MSKKKKIILIAVIAALVLAVAVAVTLVCLKKASMHGECGDNLTWEYDGNGTLTISGAGDMWDYDADNYDYPSWSKWRTEINTVIVEDGVTSIGSQAFLSNYNFMGVYQDWYVDSIVTVKLGDSIMSIGDYAFAGCTSMKKVNIPEDVTYIGEGAFRCCTGLSEFELPDGITSIEWGTFDGCSSLKQIEVPGGVTSIGNCAFQRCAELSTITLPDTLETIGSNTFAECTALEKITLPDSVKNIEGRAFSGCTGLTEIYFLGDMPFNLYGSDGDLIWLDVFGDVTARACWPAYNDTWLGTPTAFLGGNIEWVEFYP